MKKTVKTSIISIFIVIITVVCGIQLSAFGSIATSTGNRYGFDFYDVKSNYPDLGEVSNSDTFGIPGLECTNILGDTCDCMTPQGICVAGDYILITAYCNINAYKDDLKSNSSNGSNAEKLEKEENHSKHCSVIYVVSKSSKKYLTTLVLPDKNHVGGIAYDGNYIWVAKSTDEQLSAILLSDVTNAVSAGKDSVSINYYANVYCDCIASFVITYQSKLWVGVCNSDGTGIGILRGFTVSGDTADTLELTAVKELTIPAKANGAAFATIDGETCLAVNSSYGRNNDTTTFLYTVDLESDSDISVYTNYGTYTLPPMAEEICIDGSDVYTLFESGSTPYSCVDGNRCNNIVDRVCISQLDDWFYWTANNYQDEEEAVTPPEVTTPGMAYEPTSAEDAKYLNTYLYADGAVKTMYNPYTASMALDMSNTAYKISTDDTWSTSMSKYGYSQIKRVENNGVYTLGSKVTEDGTVQNLGTSVNATVGLKKVIYNGQTKYCVAIAFRGTDMTDFADVITDINLIPNGNGIHSGFADVANDFTRDCDNIKFKIDGKTVTLAEMILDMKTEGSQYQLLVTGHSLGGAVADVFVAQNLVKTNGVNPSNVVAYTFAAARSVSSSYSYNHHNIINIINADDIVPTIGGAKQIGDNITFTPDDTFREANYGSNYVEGHTSAWWINAVDSAKTGFVAHKLKPVYNSIIKNIESNVIVYAKYNTTSNNNWSGLVTLNQNCFSKITGNLTANGTINLKNINLFIGSLEVGFDRNLEINSLDGNVCLNVENYTTPEDKDGADYNFSKLMISGTYKSFLFKEANAFGVASSISFNNCDFTTNDLNIKIGSFSIINSNIVINGNLSVETYKCFGIKASDLNVSENIITDGYCGYACGINNSMINTNEFTTESLQILGDNILNANLLVNGKVEFNGKLEVNGNCQFQGHPNTFDQQLFMKHETDYLLVKGNFTCRESCSIEVDYDHLSAGAVEVKGNFSVSGKNSYIETGTHKTILSGDTTQMVDCQNNTQGLSYESCYFKNLIFKNSDIVFNSPIPNNFSLCENTILDNELKVQNDVDLNGCELICKSGITANSVKLNDGKLDLCGSMVKVFSIDSSPNKFDIINGNVETRSVNFNGLGLQINGNCNIDGAITSSYTSAKFYMTNDNDYLLVNGDLTLSCGGTWDINNNYHYGLRAGIIEVKGNYYSRGISQGGTHKIVFSGDKEQFCDSLDSSNLYFSTIELQNCSNEGVVFNKHLDVSTLFNHNNNNYTLKDGGTFPDYDGDYLGDNEDEYPLVNPIKSVEFIPIKDIVYTENVEGSWYDSNSDGIDEFHYYVDWYKEGDILRVTYVTGEIKDFVYNKNSAEFDANDGEIISINDLLHIGEQTESWGVGTENYYEVSYKSRYFTVQVTIVENPVASISYTPTKVEFIESKDGWYNSYGDYYQYYVGNREGDILIVNYTDGVSKEFKRVGWVSDEVNNCWVADDGEIIEQRDVSITDNQSQNNWIVGNTYSYTVRYMGRSCEVNATIVENLYSSITYIPASEIEIIENTNGSKETDNDGNEYYSYHSLFSYGDRIILITKDGEESVYTYQDTGVSWSGNYTGAEFSNESGENVSVTLRHNQSSEHWNAGNQYEITVDCCGLITTTVVSIIESPVASISFTPIKSYEIIENTHGYYWSGNNNSEEFYYYNIPNFNHGDVLTVTDKDGNSVSYVFNNDEYSFVTENGKVIDANLLNCNSEQYANPWSIGGENYFTVEYMGATVQIPVTIVENPVSSISFTPAKPYEIIENTHGEWNYSDDDEKYFCYYTPWFNQGDVFTITDKNGNSVDYIFNYEQNSFVSEDGNVIDANSVNCYSNQYANPWMIGDENYFTIEYMGTEDQIPVTIVENPVSSISFTPVEPYEIIENTHGYWDEYWYNEEEGNEQSGEYWRYNIPSYQDGDILTIIDKDGNSVDYIFDSEEYIFVSEDGNTIGEDSLSCYYNQYYNNQWVVGGENCFIIEYMGATANVPVSIVRCNHQYRVEIHEPTCVSDGYTHYYCEECGDSYNSDYIDATGVHSYVNGFCKYCNTKDTDYILPTISVGETKTVNIENDGDYCYFSFTPETDGNYIFSSNSDADTYGYLYDSDMNELYSNDDGGNGSNFSIRYDFEAGRTYIFGCRFYSSENIGSFDVSLDENTVKSIEFTPVEPYEIIENTHGYWDEYWYNDEEGNERSGEYWRYNPPSYQDGDILTIIDKDGNSVDYIFNSDEYVFVSEDGNTIGEDSLSCYYNQYYNNQWVVGGENYFTIEYMGVTVQVPVTIIENPVDSIEYAPVNGFVNAEGITYAPADGGTWHFRDGYVQSGDKLTVNYKNEGIKEYFAVFDDKGCYEFITTDGKKLDDDACFNLNEINHGDDWNDVTSITVNCYGKSVELPITAKITIEAIEFMPVKPVTIIESNGHEDDRQTWTDDAGHVIYGTNVYWGQDENGETTIESEIFNVGDVINVIYSNGQSASYTYYANRSFEYGYGFIGDDGSVLYVGDIHSNQNEQPWTVDGDNYFTINFSQAVTEKIPVTIVKNIDTDALTAAIEKFNEFDSKDYSEISYNYLKNIVDKNKELLDTAQSQEAIDRAVTEILEAIYDLEPYLNLTVFAENGSYEVTCDGSTSSNNKYSLLFGTEITLSATENEGYEFVGWYDVTNNLYFSTNSIYTFKLTSNTNLKAVFTKEQSATLTFATYSNWVQSTVSKTIDEWDSITSIEDLLPEVPYKYGYSNGRWVYDNDDVLSKLQTGENVTLIPEYDEDDTSLPTPRESEDGVPVLDLYYKLDADANVGSFVMAAGIPDDCQIESVGVAFYYKKANEFDPTKFELLINNKMLVSRFNTDEIEDIYIVNMNKLTSTYNWAARGYVTYYDTDGNLKTVYSNQINIVNKEQV